MLLANDTYYILFYTLSSIIFTASILQSYIFTFNSHSDSHQGVHGGGGAHGSNHLLHVGVEVATDVDGGALASVELFQDLLGVGLKGLGKGSERCVGLSEGLSPVESQVEVGGTVVGLVDSTLGSSVRVQPGADGLVEGLSEKGSLGVASFSEELKGSGSSEVLTERIPTEMVLFGELLDVERGRATSTSLEHATSGEHRDDTEHLGGGVQLEDREEIGVVISEDVTSHTDRLLASSHSLERRHGGGNGICKSNI